MRRLRFILGAAGLALSISALANGGGYAFGVKFTGSVAPFQASGTERVRIEEEILDISLRRTDAAVVVCYTMRNVTAAPVRVRFGFPVEAIWQDDLEEDPRNHRDPMQQLKGYTVTADGLPVAAKLEKESFATGKIGPFPGSDALKGIAGWMVSDVTFPAATPLKLEIRYTADYEGSCRSVSDDEQCGPFSFVYRLSTGAVWNGSIAKGAVTMRADGVPADDVEMARPLERFKRDGDRWVWTFKNLEPKLADDITVHPIPRFFTQGFYDKEALARGDRGYLEWRGKWGLGHQRFRASASSTLAPTKAHGFGAEHLAELRPPAPWAEGVAGPGLGEWVELRPIKPHPLLALSMAAGFQSFWGQNRPNLFEENGRPARVGITLNDEHRFVATLGDQRGDQIIPIVGYGKPVSKIRLTIQGVHPGARYEDTCISRVVLYDLLAKTPEIHHAR